MRRMVQIAAAITVALLGSTSTRAEDTLVVVDNSGAILGPVITGATGGSNNWTFVYQQGGAWTTLRTNGPSRVESALTPFHQALLYYEAFGCSGNPAIAIVQNCCGLDLAPLTVVDGSQVFEIDISTTVGVTVGSNRDTTAGPGDCHDFGPSLINGRPLTL